MGISSRLLACITVEQQPDHLCLDALIRRPLYNVLGRFRSDPFLDAYLAPQWSPRLTVMPLSAKGGKITLVTRQAS